VPRKKRMLKRTHAYACARARARKVQASRGRLSYRGSPVSLKTEHMTAVIRGSMHTWTAQ